MLFKIRSINELLRFFDLEKIYISKKQTELNELRQTVLSSLEIFLFF